MRIFFAIELTPEVAAAIQHIVAELKALNPKVEMRWTKVVNLHITLQFLAHIEPLELNALLHEVVQETKDFGAFTIQFEQVSFFPSLKHPSVLALRIQVSEALTQLEYKLRRALDARSYQVDMRLYKPHVTLGRLNHDYPVRRFKLIDVPEMSLAVDHFNLYQSKLTEAGRQYQILERFEL